MPGNHLHHTPQQPTLEDDTAKHLVRYLQQAKDLAVVEIHLSGPGLRSRQPPDELARLEAWKPRFIDVLKNSPSKNRKFLRWNLVRLTMQPGDPRYMWEVLEAGELEVLPGPSQ